MIGTCKNCKFYHAPDGSEDRWYICINPKMKLIDAYDNYKNIPQDGIGNSQQSNWEHDNELYVGENFGCIHFENK